MGGATTVALLPRHRRPRLGDGGGAARPHRPAGDLAPDAGARGGARGRAVPPGRATPTAQPGGTAAPADRSRSRRASRQRPGHDDGARAGDPGAPHRGRAPDDDRRRDRTVRRLPGRAVHDADVRRRCCRCRLRRAGPRRGRPRDLDEPPTPRMPPRNSSRASRSGPRCRRAMPGPATLESGSRPCCGSRSFSSTSHTEPGASSRTRCGARTVPTERQPR